MNDVSRFLLSAALGVGAACIMLAACGTDRRARGLALGFLGMCSLVALGNLLGVVGVALDLSPGAPTHRHMLAALGPIHPGIAGAGVGMAMAGALALARNRAHPRSGLPLSPKVGHGLACYAALSFLAFEVGKLAHDDQMRQFFTASGYSIAFMYVVMAAELLGAIGLLSTRTRLAAACGVSALMAGAIGTHLRNGDPFADSLDALRMLLVLMSLAVLSTMSGRLRKKTQGEPMRVHTAT